MTTTQKDSGLCMAVLLAAGLFALGQAVQTNRGAFDPVAIQWLTFVVFATLIAALQPRVSCPEARAEALIVLVAGLGFAYQMSQLVTVIPGNIGEPGARLLAPYHRAMASAAVIGGAGLAKQPWLGRFQPLLLILPYVYAAAWMIHMQPDPFIDVYVFQRGAVDALLAGDNPWALRYPDIYGGDSNLYGEGLSVNGRLQFGFPYPPVTLLLDAIAQKFGDDPRYAHVACIGLAGLLIAYARPGRIGNALAALFLFTPRSFFIIDQGWTEPHIILGLSATVFAALRFPKATPFALGVFMATKQYCVFALPLSWLLVPPSSRSDAAKWLLKALGTTAALIVPFALWNLAEFWRAVAEVQLLQPFRHDALSYLVWWTRRGHPAPSSAWGFVAAMVGVAISLWRLPRSPYGFATGIGLTFLLFFAFNKQAFCNYYYFVAGALAVAGAAVQPRNAAASGAASVEL